MFTAIVSLLTVTLPKLVDFIGMAVTAYQAHVKLLWSNSLQAGLQPLEQGQPTSDQQKAEAAKAVAQAIANMH